VNQALSALSWLECEISLCLHAVSSTLYIFVGLVCVVLERMRLF
jgi:hypothetical protein